MTGAKWESYREIADLQQYVMLSVDHVGAEIYVRRRGDEWTFVVVEDAEADLRFPRSAPQEVAPSASRALMPRLAGAGEESR